MTRAVRPGEIREQSTPVAGADPAPGDKTAIVPVPGDALPLRFRHPQYGVPSQTWPYHNATGELMGYVGRFDYEEDGSARKLILPLAFCQLPGGKRAWRAKGLAEPRPLYRLPAIVTVEEGQESPRVLVCEGEKTADAAAELFPDWVCTTPMHGARSPHKTDWSPLRGRSVIIAPDADAAGRDFAKAVAGLLTKAGVKDISLLNTAFFSGTVWRNGERQSRHWSMNQGYDLADALKDGWSSERVTSLGGALVERYSDRGVDDLRWTEVRTHGEIFRFDEESVEVRRSDKEGILRWERISSRLVVRGYARTVESEDWGYLIEVRDPDGRDKRLIVAAKLLAGDGKAVREALLSAGARIAQDRASREALLTYIADCEPPMRLLSVRSPGWHNGRFVLPDEAFGAASDEEYAIDGGRSAPFACGGSLESWKAGIGSLALGNSRLVFALSAAFAGPLLLPVGAESGAFHFVGNSSSGKSIAQMMAASVWGKGHLSGFVSTWRNTDNALEYIAEARTDTLLVLDELGLADPTKVGEIAYMLSQNKGKGRATAEGGLAETPEWRILTLSSGEVRLEEMIASAGPRARAKAGQVLRFVTIPADVGRGMGIFETLHGHATPGHLWDVLSVAAQTHYGHASRAYLEALVGMREKASDLVRDGIEEFVARHCDDQSHGQLRRVAVKFGLVAAAGELAASLGILPWQKGDAFEAASACFSAWLDGRGGGLSEEAREALRVVKGFIEAHGASRFEVFDEQQAEPGFDRQVLNRAGYRRRVDGGWEYYFLSEAWRDLTRGTDPTMVARVLRDQGHLEPGENGRLQKKVRLPGIAGSARCYVIKPTLLADPEEGADG